MKKKLPRIKKSLKSFILDEDAKVVDKSITKLSIIGVILLGSISTASACKMWEKHNNHYNHYNVLNAPLSKGTDVHAGTNANIEMKSNVTAKSVETLHANHANRIDKCSLSLLQLFILLSSLALAGLSIFAGLTIAALGTLIDESDNDADALQAIFHVLPDEDLEPLCDESK